MGNRKHPKFPHDFGHEIQPSRDDPNIPRSLRVVVGFTGFTYPGTILLLWYHTNHTIHIVNSNIYMKYSNYIWYRCTCGGAKPFEKPWQNSYRCVCFHFLFTIWQLITAPLVLIFPLWPGWVSSFCCRCRCWPLASFISSVANGDWKPCRMPPRPVIRATRCTEKAKNEWQKWQKINGNHLP